MKKNSKLRFPSALHKNRKAFNYSVYDNMDFYLELCSRYIKGTVYDLGCGTAPYRDWILNYADKYVGVDWGDSLHELKAEILSDLNEPLSIDCGVADTVMSISVMEHLREPQMFLNEAHRILKPGGCIVLQVPFMWWVHETPHDFYRYTRYGLQYMFEKAGFTEITIYTQSGFWVMWTLKFNYQTRNLIRGPWPVRKVIELIMLGVWAIDQKVALWLDRYWKAEGETIGYFVVARKM